VILPSASSFFSLIISIRLGLLFVLREKKSSFFFIPWPLWLFRVLVLFLSLLGREEEDKDKDKEDKDKDKEDKDKDKEDKDGALSLLLSVDEFNDENDNNM